MYQVKHIIRKAGKVEWKIVCTKNGIPTQFATRKKARNFLRNHRRAFSERPTIIHPEGRCEELPGIFTGDER